MRCKRCKTEIGFQDVCPVCGVKDPIYQSYNSPNTQTYTSPQSNNYQPNNYQPNNYPQNNYPQNNYPPNNYPNNYPTYNQNNYMPPQSESSSWKAIVGFILGLLACIGGGLIPGLLARYFCNSYLSFHRNGQNQGLAKAGNILAIIGLVEFGIAICLTLFAACASVMANY